MIKLIASDMDGTLLNDDKQLPSDFFEVLDALERIGVKFAVSSGRTYAAVEHLFPQEYVKKMDFICDNGAYIVHGGKPVHIQAMERQLFTDLITECEKIGGLKVLVCAEGGTYHLPADEQFDREVAKFYTNHITCDDLLAVQDTIFKVAICDEQGAQERAKPAIDAVFGGRLNVQVSGKIWMDVMAHGVNKGTGLAELGKALGVSAEDTMAIGDYFNDVDMLKYAGWSFCKENGNEEVKKLCRYIAPCNNDGGVTKAIRRYVLGEVTV